jgi:hypothetical protein
MHDLRCLACGRLRVGWPFLKFFLRCAASAFAADQRWRGREGHLWVRCPHHLVRETVRLMLQRIIDSADFEFRLNGTREMCRRIRRKDRDFAKIPRRRRRVDGRAGIIIVLVDVARALGQKPERRLIADAPLEHVRLTDRRLAGRMRHNLRAWGMHCLRLCYRRSKHYCSLPRVALINGQYALAYNQKVRKGSKAESRIDPAPLSVLRLCGEAPVLQTVCTNIRSG